MGGNKVSCLVTNNRYPAHGRVGFKRRLDSRSIEDSSSERKIIVRSLAPQGSTLQPATDVRLVSASVVPHSVVTTLQLSVSALAIAAVVFAAIVGWRYQSVRANQVWLDQCRAEYEWHHEVPQLERPIWQRTQKDLANAIGPACVSDFHTVKLAGELHDDSLSRVSRLKHVQKLTLESDLATDKTLQRLSHLRQLENLTLSANSLVSKACWN